MHLSFAAAFFFFCQLVALVSHLTSVSLSVFAGKISHVGDGKHCRWDVLRVGERLHRQC